ncbi:MAG: DNA helicase II [Legionellales bacterium]|nr:DNA helicase II [Legionellales bacterium]
MDMTHILENLNEAQREAVTAESSHLVVLAGAGSGKTSVLVKRIAWLIQAESLSPYSIFAVTFTNKAAGEMRARIEQLLGFQATGMWVGTFHSIAHKLLRKHWQAARLDENFQIIDAEDQLRIIKRLLKSLNLDDKQWAPRAQQWFINHNKEEGLRAHHLSDDGDIIKKTQIKIYQAYEEICQNANLVDFSELLLRAHELWRDNPDILQHYQNRFQYILIDEFQDTNQLQYAWLNLLAGQNNHVTIVGDDDQSIYGWRGAQVENIHKFTRDFPHTKTIRLEQNYRSTGYILKAANKVIANNQGRMGKNLWTHDGDGDKIQLYAAFNELDEARFITAQILQWIEHGNNRNECAILYRSNAQSRVLEEALIQANIPYRIYGGLRFFERQEIKDTLAYLRLIFNRHDDAAFERVINTPTRGLGEKTIAQIRHEAREKQASLWTASLLLLENKQLPARASTALNGFIQLINTADKETTQVDLAEQVEHILSSSGLLNMYQNASGEKAQARIENLQELVVAAKQFTPEDGSELPLIAEFLTHAALEAGEGQEKAFADSVQLMTLHSAKGLEFPLVFIGGMEEGLFPHYLSVNDPNQIEEERRLCYVGMTRAMKNLYLTFAETRRMYGSESRNRPSRFLTELPNDCVNEVRMRTKIIKPVGHTANLPFRMKKQVHESGYQLGQQVMHAKFGEGVILNIEGKGAHTRVQVNFEHAGTKWLVAAYAKLQ